MIFSQGNRIGTIIGIVCMHIRCVLRNMRLAVRANRHFIRKFTSTSRTNHRMSQPFSSTQPFTEPCSRKAFCSALHYSKHAFSCQVAEDIPRNLTANNNCPYQTNCLIRAVLTFIHMVTIGF